MKETVNISFRSTVVNSDRIGLAALKRALAGEDIKIIRPVTTGLVMMAVRDSCNNAFYLGEVLVTETEVEHNGYRGYGMITGDEPEKAHVMAAIDAILQSGNSRASKQVYKTIVIQEKRNKRRMKREESLIANTTVSFELMSAR